MSTSESVQGHAYNTGKREESLHRKIHKAHNWSVRVQAQTDKKIGNLQAELRNMGCEEVALFKPDLSKPENVDLYTRMDLNTAHDPVAGPSQP